MVKQRQLIYEVDFTQLNEVPSEWNVQDRGDRVQGDNVYVDAEGLSIYTQPSPDPADDRWYGGSVVLEIPRTYGRFEVNVRVDAARFTKALALMWDPTEWPPEIDFMELGDTNWERQYNACTAHWAPQNFMIHRSYRVNLADMFQSVGLTWRERAIKFRLNGQVQPNMWGKDIRTEFDNPGIHEQMKLHLTYWPTHKLPSDPWPMAASRMVVRNVRVWE